MWMTFYHLKTNCTKFAHHRFKIRKVIEFFLLSVLDATSPLYAFHTHQILMACMYFAVMRCVDELIAQKTTEFGISIATTLIRPFYFYRANVPNFGYYCTHDFRRIQNNVHRFCQILVPISSQPNKLLPKLRGLT